MSRGSTEHVTVRKARASRLPVVAVITIMLACMPAWSQDSASAGAPGEKPKAKSFAKPEEAVAALFAAAKRNDEAELLVILGPDAREVIEWSDDQGERQRHREMFVQKYEQMHRLVKEPDNTVALYVGSENWPLPIPLIQYQGAWYFDAELGKQEIRYRRIGRNEMEAVEVCKALVDAEKEYRATAHQYTAKFVSSDDSHDGLYWKSGDGATKSPIGPYLAHAGVDGIDKSRSQPFHGYHYRILLQGSDALAILAFPAEYRSSGVTTFLVTQDGTAYEKDLGDQTATLSTQISSPAADNSWKPVD
jgi:hypothetical protein